MSLKLADIVPAFSLQLADRHKAATPADRRQGEDVIIGPSVDDEAARTLFPEGWTTHQPYLRTVRQPASADARQANG